jgi:hypothetical protein
VRRASPASLAPEAHQFLEAAGHSLESDRARLEGGPGHGAARIESAYAVPVRRWQSVQWQA